MKNKTIIYTGGFALPDKNAAANRVVSNGKIFDKLGCKTVFLGLSDSEERFEGIREINGQINMFEQARPFSTKQWVKRIFDISAISSLAEKYNADTVILYNLPFFTLWRAKKALSKKNIEVAYDCTEWTKGTDGSLPKRLFKAFDEILIRNFAHKVSDGMIAISKMMEKKYKSAKKLLILPPLVDIDDEIWHQKTDSDEGVFEFCFAGIPDGKKESLDKVVEAFCRMNKENTRLRIIGITENDFKNIYPDCIIPDNISGEIEFMGRKSHAETIRRISGCDCYVFIRRSDRRNNAGFPTKFAESFTCRVPIITTDVSDVGEYIKKSGRGTVLDDMSVAEIADAMISAVKKGKNIPREPDTAFHYATFIKETEKWLE